MTSKEPELELMRSLQSEEFADLEVRCGPYHFKVHKVLLCTRSPWFAAACRKDAFKEGEEGIITLKSIDEVSEGDKDTADDPEAVRLMIHYFYHLDYLGDKNGNSTREAPPVPTDPESSSDTDIEYNRCAGKKKSKKAKKCVKSYARWPAKSDCGVIEVYDAKPKSSPESPSSDMSATNNGGDLVMHAKLYSLADKYGVSGLKALSRAKFKASIHDNWNGPELASATLVAYTSTADEDTDLRRVVADNLMSHLSTVLRKPEVACAIDEVGGLALDLLRRTQGIR
ncbi:hypothetical protein LTR28_007268 [Elasticomyces elasticus]|nr:hypothetical protein LTR28_007268 [Elasticomyces elasticus]